MRNSRAFKFLRDSWAVWGCFVLIALIALAPASASYIQQLVLAGDATGPIASNTVVKVNGVSYSASPATDTAPVITAANTATYKNLPDCSSALTYATSSHSFACNASAPVTSGTYYLTTNLGTFGPIFPMTPPSAVSFAWRNQGSATVAASGDAFFLSTPALVTDSIKGREITAPGTPWSVAIGFVSTQSANQAFSSVGMYVADNGTGRLTTVGMAGAASGGINNAVWISNWTNATTFSANVFNKAETNETRWLKIQDDGTNLNFFRSADGQNWGTAIFSVARTTFLANPNRVGFYVNSANATYPVTMTLLSWTQGV